MPSFIMSGGSSSGGGASVTSVFGRTGAVVSAANDYDFSQLSGTASTAQIPNLAASKITSGLLALARGGTNADLSATGAASNVLMQLSSGAAITVAQLAFSDLSGSIAAGQIASGTVTWDKIGNAAAALTLAQAGNNSTFNHTSSATWKWANTTAATSSTGASSPIFSFSGANFTTGASATDLWTIQAVVVTPKNFAVSNIAETVGNVVTLTVTGHNFIVGEIICPTGLTTGTWLNGLNFTVLTAPANTITFTDTTAHGLQASHAETGTATQANTPNQFTFVHSGTANAQISIPSHAASGGPSVTDGTGNSAMGINVSPGSSLGMEVYNANADTIRLMDSTNKNIVGGIGFNNNAKVMYIGPVNTNNYTSLLVGPTVATAAALVPLVSIGGGISITAGLTSSTTDVVGVSLGTVDGVLPVTSATTAGRSLVFSPASGAAKFTALNINPIINQTGSASGTYTGLKVNVTETAYLGSTTGSNLLDLQLGQNSVFSISRLGQETFTGTHGEQWIYGSNTELLTLSTGGATTDTAGNLLPANSVIEAVVARVTTTITTATNWKLGDGTQGARFSAINSTMTSGTTQVGTAHVDQTGNLGPIQTAAAKVRVTTTGTPGAGIVRITVFYRQYVPPTS